MAPSLVAKQTRRGKKSQAVPRSVASGFSKTWVRVFAVLVASTAVYLLLAVLCNNLKKHETVYFDYLADAFLHGRLYLSNPPALYDLTFYRGQWYVPFLPLPAVLMLPLVALAGPNNGLEVPFSTLLGGINVALVYLLLESMRQRRWNQLGSGSNVWVAALFGFGTAHWYIALNGDVWSLSQIVSVTFLSLTLLLAVRRAQPLWIGASLGLTLWTRPNLVLVLPFLIAELISREAVPARTRIRQLLALLAPLTLSAAGILCYNWARFEDPRDFGYLRENVARKLAADLHTYGQFNLKFLPRNVEVAFGRLPQFHAKFPFFTPDAKGEGISLLFVTPALFYLFRRVPRRLWMRGAWAAIILLNIPLLLYYNTGWHQFGYRFSLDYVVVMLCLIAANAGKKVSIPLALLIALSVLVNARGVWWWFYGQHVY